MAACDAADYAGLAGGGVEYEAAEPDHNATSEAALRFLNALFGSKPAELFILIWLLATKKSSWFRDPLSAAQ
jgi:hypothetical protein